MRSVSAPEPQRSGRLGRLLVVGAAGAALLVACSSDDADDAGETRNLVRVTTDRGSAAAGSTDVGNSSSSDESTPDTPATTDVESTDTASTDTASTETSSSTTSTSSSTSTSTSTTTTTTIDPLDVEHAVPVEPDANISYTPQAHTNYQATDIFSSDGCGTGLVSPVTGTVDEVLTNTYDPAVDDPATRGGNAVAIIGDDGVRYYLAHFQRIDPVIMAGVRVTVGQALGEMGDTGRSGACHVHFGLSLDCPDNPDDWFIRRGVIWPEEYLDSWRDGGNLSPLPALQDWFAEYPDACTSVENTPYPVG